MEKLSKKYTPTDEFILYLTHMNYHEYKKRDKCYSQNKRIVKKYRNDYENRLRPKNLRLYYIDDVIRKKNKQAKDAVQKAMVLHESVK